MAAPLRETAVDVPVTPRPPIPLPRPWRSTLSFRRISLVYVFASLFVLFSLWVPETFLTTTTLKTLLSQQAEIAILSIGLVIPLAAAAYDLSIAANLGFAAVVGSKLMVDDGWPPVAAIIFTMLVGALIGAVNGTMVVTFKIDAFIATLAMSSVLAALILAVSDNRPAVGVPASFKRLGGAGPLGLALPVWYLVVLAFVLWFVLEHTVVGRRLYATGGNRDATRLSGVRVGRVVFLALVTSGTIAALAGLVATARIGAGSPTLGPSYLLPAFAAAFLGSTQFREGRFNIAGTVLAVYVLATGVKGLQLAGAPFWLPDLFNGLALAVAVGLAKSQRRPRVGAVNVSAAHAQT